MRLLEKTDIKDGNALLSEWQLTQYKIWEEIVGNKAFPCHFGTQAEKMGTLRYCFLEKEDLIQLPEVLSEFLELSRRRPKKRYAMVVFLKPETKKRNFDFYKDHFWHILNYLHAKDTIEWPEAYPKDPTDPHWEFVFNGEQIFVSGNMPAYENRISRKIGDSQILIFQPRRIFAGITDAPSGYKSIQLIRKKLVALENLPIHHDLGEYGTESLEWKQYLITDDDTEETGKCPFHLLEEADSASHQVKNEK